MKIEFEYLMSRRQVASALNVTDQRVMQLAQSGELKVWEVDKIKLFYRPEIIEYIEKRNRIKNRQSDKNVVFEEPEE